MSLTISLDLLQSTRGPFTAMHWVTTGSTWHKGILIENRGIGLTFLVAYVVKPPPAVIQHVWVYVYPLPPSHAVVPSSS